MFGVEAEVAYAIQRAEPEEPHARRPMPGFDGLFAKQVGAQVFLVRVAEHRGHHRILAELFLCQHRRDQVGAARNADAEPELRRQFLRHEDRVPVVNRDHAIELVEVHDRRNELVAHALNAVLAHLVSRRQRGRVRWLHGMETDRGAHAPEEAPRTHDRTAGSYTSHERRRHEILRLQLRPEFRSRGPEVRVAVRLVAELAREERTRGVRGEFLGAPDRSEEASFFLRHEPYVRAERPDERDPFRAHPVRHEDRHRVSERAPDRAERDARVAARSLDDHSPRLQDAGFEGLAHDVERHPVLDALGQAEVLGLRVQVTRAPVVQRELDREQRRVAHKHTKTPQPLRESEPAHGFFVAGGAAGLGRAVTVTH